MERGKGGKVVLWPTVIEWGVFGSGGVWEWKEVADDCRRGWVVGGSEEDV